MFFAIRKLIPLNILFSIISGFILMALLPQTVVASDKAILHLFAMSDYIPEEIIKNFEKKFNARIKYDVFSNNEELLAKFQAGARGYDVIIPSDYIIKALTAGGYLSSLEHSRLPNLKNLAEEFTKSPYDPGNQYTIPYTWGTTGLVYNAKKIKQPITSWKQLDNSEYKGKIALLDDSREVFGAFLHSKGYSSNSTQTDQLKQAQQDLIKLKPLVRLFSSDPKQHVLNGEVWIAQIYSGDAYVVSKKKPELKYVVPQEGATVWVDNLAIPKTAQNVDLAYSFINYLLDAEVNSRLTNELGYASPNAAAEKKIKDASLKSVNVKKLTSSKLEFLKDLGKSNDQIDQMWTEAKMR